MEVIWSNPYAQLELVSQSQVHMAFEYLQGGRLRNLPGQFMP